MKVDDYPYGGGAGLVMQPEPVYRAYKDLEKDMKKKPRVVYLTPQGLSLIHISSTERTWELVVKTLAALK